MQSQYNILRSGGMVNRLKNQETEQSLKKNSLTTQHETITADMKGLDKFGILQHLKKRITEESNKLELYMNEMVHKKKFDIGFYDEMKKDLELINQKFKKLGSKYQVLNENTIMNFNLLKKLEDSLITNSDCFKRSQEQSKIND